MLTIGQLREWAGRRLACEESIGWMEEFKPAEPAQMLWWDAPFDWLDWVVWKTTIEFPEGRAEWLSTGKLSRDEESEAVLTMFPYEVLEEWILADISRSVTN